MWRCEIAKRFTNTTKWDKLWFRKLSPLYKCFWFYLCDNCNHAGIWEVDIEFAEFYIGEKLNNEEINKYFEKQIAVIDDGKRWFIKDFIKFQYVELREINKVHKSVINILKDYNLIDEEGNLIGLDISLEIPIEESLKSETETKDKITKTNKKKKEKGQEVMNGFGKSLEIEIEKEHELQKIIKTKNKDGEYKYESIIKLKKQLTYEEAEKLCKKYDKSAILNVLDAMENKRDLTIKYKSCYLTINNWCKRDMEKMESGINLKEKPLYKPLT